MHNVESLHVFQHRGGLRRTLHRLQERSLIVGFLGGSITDARPGHNWPEPVMSWFVERFPDVRFFIENAAIGATGSDLAVFRAERDIIKRDCDLVFVEYAVNDAAPSETTKRSREGLLRKLLAGEGRDVVLVYTFNQPMYAYMSNGQMPPSIVEMEELGKHYNLPSVWMSLHAFRDVMAGRMRWEEWLPDGLHPESRGSLSYAQSVISFLEQELLTAPGGEAMLIGETRPEPLTIRNWEHATTLPFAAVTLQGPWSIRRWPHVVWIDQVLATAAIGARLSFSFTGHGLVLSFDFGKTSAEFRYRLDEGEWQTVARERPAWCTTNGWFRPELLADDLLDGEHTCELVVIHGDRPECTGTNFNLAFIGILQ